MCYRWQLREVAYPKACQAAGSCKLLFCLSARRNSRVSTQSFLPTRYLCDWHDFLSFSITILGVQSEHCLKILLQWTADRWHIIILPGKNTTAYFSLWSNVFIDFSSTSINTRIKGTWQWCKLSNHIFFSQWPYYWTKMLCCAYI